MTSIVPSAMGPLDRSLLVHSPQGSSQTQAAHVCPQEPFNEDINPANGADVAETKQYDSPDAVDPDILPRLGDRALLHFQGFSKNKSKRAVAGKKR